MLGLSCPKYVLLLHRFIMLTKIDTPDQTNLLRGGRKFRQFPNQVHQNKVNQS
jgi:hypothetical protein